MDEPPRGALLLVRFTAAGITGLGVMELGLYVGECHLHHQPVGILHGTLLFLPIVLGIVFFAKGRTIADWISDQFDL